MVALPIRRSIRCNSPAAVFESGVFVHPMQMLPSSSMPPFLRSPEIQLCPILAVSKADLSNPLTQHHLFQQRWLCLQVILAHAMSVPLAPQSPHA